MRALEVHLSHIYLRAMEEFRARKCTRLRFKGSLDDNVQLVPARRTMHQLMTQFSSRSTGSILRDLLNTRGLAVFSFVNEWSPE